MERKDRREVDTEGLGYCDLHGGPVDEDEYSWKGCWNCLHFTEGESFPYVFLAEILRIEAGDEVEYPASNGDIIIRKARRR